jgi:acetoin utilization deacetylase AcuC-like enzyme
MGWAMDELLLIEQRAGERDADSAHWILEDGRILPGVDDNRRMAELRRGLLRHAGVRACEADADGEEVEQTLSVLHEPDYLEALGEVGEEPVVIAELTPPGLPPDIPVSAGLVEAAREGVRTAVTAAARLAAGARFTYALCRPPGHHAGPGWFAGYCYLNTAAAAVQTLRQAGTPSIGILDLDLHYPNGTAAIVAPMEDVCLFSLHAWPVTNLASGTVEPTTDREVAVEYHVIPEPRDYLARVGKCLDEAREDYDVASFVVSLGYDLIAGDPHGSWDFEPGVFGDIGALLAGAGLPVCVVQEGGYALDSLAACAEAFAAGLLGRPYASAVQPPRRNVATTQNGRLP